MIPERRSYRDYYMANIDQQRKQQRQYYYANKETHKIRNMHRRAIKRASEGKHTLFDIKRQYANQKGKCYYCRKKVEWGKHHVDHVVPLSRGGSNDIDNLVIACPTCNLKKHNKLPHEWPEGGRLL